MSIHLVMGDCINRISQKSIQMLNDITYIKQLLFRLITGCSVSFLACLLDIKAKNHNHSVFKYIDSESHNLLSNIEKLAKERVYKVIPNKVSDDEIMDCISDDEIDVEDATQSTSHAKIQQDTKEDIDTSGVFKRDIKNDSEWPLDKI